MIPHLSYFICAAPRSGSTLLSDALGQTGVAGTPAEYFNNEFYGMRLEDWGIPSLPTFADYVQCAREAATTRNGICGIKFVGAQLDDLAFHLGGTAEEIDFERWFPNLRYIFVRRNDRVRQAISLYRAVVTRKWVDIDGSDLPYVRDVDVHYDFRRILSLEQHLERVDAKWREFFRARRLEPFVVTYEDFAADYAGGVRRVLRHLGIRNANTLRIDPPRMKKQADDESEEWAVRFAADRRRMTIASGSVPDRRTSRALRRRRAALAGAPRSGFRRGAR